MPSKRKQYLADREQRVKEGTTARGNAVIAQHLEPGERVMAESEMYTGPSDKWLSLDTRRGDSLGQIIVSFQRRYWVAVTDRRVILCRFSAQYFRGDAVTSVPREHAQVSDYQPGKMFRFSYPDRKRPMKFRAHRKWKREAMNVVNALTGAQAAQGMPVPGLQPGARPYQAPGPR
jgi:hypothetical protein